MRNLFYLFLLSLFLVSCQKDTITKTLIIEDNNAPHYDEVTIVQIQNYINKIYIDVLGREPLDSELTSASSTLKTNSLSDASREQLLIALMDTDEYYDRFYEVYQTAYLPGVTDYALDESIFTFETARDIAVDDGNTILAQLIELELIYLYALRNLQDDYQNGNVNINEFMKIICTNNFYDEINMGAENFALSCFENFLKRYPTDAELAASVAMIDGSPSQVFLSDGNSKEDFVNIIFSIPEFYQGLAIDVYNQLLVRQPTSQEMNDMIFILQDAQDFQAVQRIVLKSDEYAGF